MSQDEATDKDSIRAKIMLNQASGTGNSKKQFDIPAQHLVAPIGAIRRDDGAASSSGGIITPLGMNKVPMTDRNWNNSELKKFSVTQSRSNADILEELRRAQMPEIVNHLIEDMQDGRNGVAASVSKVNEETDGENTAAGQRGGNNNDLTDDDVRTAEL